MADLSVEIADLHFKNPLISAAGPNTKNYSIVLKGIKAGCGGIVVRALHLQTVDQKQGPVREFWYVDHIDKPFKRKFYSFQSKGALALKQSIGVPPGYGGAAPTPTLKEWVKEVKQMKKAAQENDCILIANIGWCGDYFSSEELWRTEALAMAEAGVDALELHTGPCPTIEPGRYIQFDPKKYLEMPIRLVKKLANLPVFAKLPVDYCDVVIAGKIAEAAGADAIIPATRWISLKVDVENEKNPIWPGLMGYGGPWSVPIMNAYIYRMRERKEGIDFDCCSVPKEGQPEKVTIPIIASGGVTSGRDVIGYLMLGANAVQICAQILLEGYGVIERINKEIREWMERKGYSHLKEFMGIIKTIDPSQMQKIPQLRATVNESLCTGCKLCIEPCTNEAIVLTDGVARVITEKCEGCRNCYEVCPTGAIALQEI